MNRAHEVFLMARDGRSEAEIAAKTGLTLTTVRTYRSRGRHGGGPRPRDSWPRALSVEAQIGLAPMARARRLSIPELAVLIVEVAVREGLVGAVLDDADD